jgi:hypothetical protein
MNQNLLVYLGGLGLFSGAIIVADFGPLVTKIAGVFATFSNSFGLMLARRNNVTSEQVIKPAS